MDGYAEGHAWAQIDSCLMATKTYGYTEGRVRQNMSPNTQQKDSSMRAVKTYGSAESRARHEEDSWEAIDDNAKGCN